MDHDKIYNPRKDATSLSLFLSCMRTAMCMCMGMCIEMQESVQEQFLKRNCQVDTELKGNGSRLIGLGVCNGSNTSRSIYDRKPAPGDWSTPTLHTHMGEKKQIAFCVSS